MINYIFSPFYYKGKVKNHVTMKEELVPYIENKYEENPDNHPYGWECNVHTSYLYTESILEKYKNDYILNVIDFFKEINFPNCEIEIFDSWYNVYRKGQWQEVHHHSGEGGDYFSAVHFLKFNKEVHSPISFSNSNRVLLQPYKLGRKSSIDYWNINNFADVEEGDIIIFPSCLEHSVPPQTTDESRITISFNIKVKS